MKIYNMRPDEKNKNFDLGNSEQRIRSNVAFWA